MDSQDACQGEDIHEGRDTSTKWAKEKFEYIGKKGKTNMLYYLATKTVADFNVYIGKSLKLTPKLKGKTGEYKITFVEEDDRITISWENKMNLANITDAAMKNVVAGPMDISKILMDGTPEVEELRRLCRERSEGTYPPKGVEDRFMHMEEWLKPEKSTIEGAGDGLHARGKRRLKKGEIVGVYGGNIIGESDGQYTLEISREGKGSIWVDAQLGHGRYNKFGMMNEDLHRGRCNAEIGADGFIKIIEECEEEELFTRYGSKYNWDSIKQKALTGLITDIVNLFPGHESRITPEWSELKRKQDPISRWVRRVINGRTTSSERHGIICWKDEKGSFEEMIGYITYGPNTVRYNFKHWGQVLEQYGTKKMGKKSNLMNF